MSKTKIKDSFKELNKKMEEFEKQFREEGSKLFKEITKEVFDQFPEVNSFSWTQYTPYFNDGDECTFGVNDVDTINGFSEYGDDDENDQKNSENIFEKYNWEKSKSDKRAFEIVETLRAFVNSAPEDVLRSLFGDHARVTVYRDKKAKVEEYEHD